MKSLMLGWELPPLNSGGLGVACYSLCKALARHQVDIDFVVPYINQPKVDFMNIVPASGFTAEVLRQSGGAYDSNMWSERFESKPEEPGDLHRQRAYFTKFVSHQATTDDYDVIHAHEWLTFEAGLAAKYATGKPLVAHVHATEFDRSGEFCGDPLVHEIEETALLEADRIVAVSQHTKEIIIKNYGIPGDKIDVVHNGIDRADIAPTGEVKSYHYLRFMQQRGYKVVVNIGRLTTQKGLHYLMEAAARVVSINPKVLFLIVGNGELRDELLEQSASLGIARNVIFIGFLRGQALRDAFTVGDLFVMPSISEPFGLTALEAMAFGTPVLMSRTSGASEVAPNTLKVDYWDATGMADKILATLAQPALSQSLVKNGQRDLERLSWHHAATKCLDSYRAACPTAGVYS